MAPKKFQVPHPARGSGSVGKIGQLGEKKKRGPGRMKGNGFGPSGIGTPFGPNGRPGWG